MQPKASHDAPERKNSKQKRKKKNIHGITRTASESDSCFSSMACMWCRLDRVEANSPSRATNASSKEAVFLWSLIQAAHKAHALDGHPHTTHTHTQTNVRDCCARFLLQLGKVAGRALQVRTLRLHSGSKALSHHLAAITRSKPNTVPSAFVRRANKPSQAKPSKAERQPERNTNPTTPSTAITTTTTTTTETTTTGLLNGTGVRYALDYPATPTPTPSPWPPLPQ